MSISTADLIALLEPVIGVGLFLCSICSITFATAGSRKLTSSGLFLNADAGDKPGSSVPIVYGERNVKSSTVSPVKETGATDDCGYKCISGTVKPCHRHILVCDERYPPSDWPKHVEKIDVFPFSLMSSLSECSHMKIKTTVCDYQPLAPLVSPLSNRPTTLMTGLQNLNTTTENPREERSHLRCRFILYPEEIMISVDLKAGADSVDLFDLDDLRDMLTSTDPVAYLHQLQQKRRATSTAPFPYHIMSPLPWKSLILVCVHGSRDARCGRAGPQVIDELNSVLNPIPPADQACSLGSGASKTVTVVNPSWTNEHEVALQKQLLAHRAGVQLLKQQQLEYFSGNNASSGSSNSRSGISNSRCRSSIIAVCGGSHIGGHKYAGTLIAYPAGDWYGYITKRNVRVLLSHVLGAVDGVYQRCWRGNGFAMPAPEPVPAVSSDAAAGAAIDIESVVPVGESGGAFIKQQEQQQQQEQELQQDQQQEKEEACHSTLLASGQPTALAVSNSVKESADNTGEPPLTW